MTSPTRAFWRAAAVTTIALGGLVVQANLADGAPPPCSISVSYPDQYGHGTLGFPASVSCPGARSVSYEFTILRAGAPWTAIYGSLPTPPHVSASCVRGGPPVNFRGSIFVTARYPRGLVRIRTARGPGFTWRCR